MAVRSVAIIFDNKVRPDTTGVYCRRGLGQLVEVEHFLPTELSRIPRQGFDLYLNIDDGLEYRLPRHLRPCAWWGIDTHLNLPWYLEKAPDFDWVFTAQRDGAEALRRAGIASAAWLPLACDPEFHRKHEVKKTLDICFIGNIFPGPRMELLELIRQRFRNTFVGQRFFEEMARTFSSSRITFNRSIRNDINMRVFEALACGSLLLTNDLTENGQAELFQDGVHLATYRDPEEMLDKIAFYLDRAEVCERIAAAGRTQVLAKDTYRHRMERILGEVERAPLRVSAGPSSNRDDEGRGSDSPPAAEDGASHTETMQVAVEPRGQLPPETLALALAALVPASARRALLIGAGVTPLVATLRERHPAEVTLIDLPADTAVGTLDQVLLDRLAQKEPAFTQQSSDAIVVDGILYRLHDPVTLLRQLSPLLAPDGRLLATLPNLRHHGIVRALLEGNWPYEPAGTGDGHPASCFTRRSIEKLFYRAGLSIVDLRVIPGPDYQEWRQQGCQGTVKVGRLHIGGLLSLDAEEFYAAGYLVSATPAPAADHGLTSIVILTHNQLHYTRQCVDSIRRYTDEPYELIFVDNASTDGTVEYLRALPGAKIIVNSDNRGFPAGCNQGIQVATGRQILLLNNDCVVTTSWLRRLLRPLETDAKIGLVGPCSNNVSGEQQVAISYDDLLGLDGFAWEWGKANNRALRETDRLVGFCLLIRRQVVERVGLLDERFGVGCFEDDDYCVRALRAGFRAVIAQDAFVHHAGGRTFIASGVDFAALMQRNQKLFREKWDQPQPKAESPTPQPTAGVTPRPSRYALKAQPGGGLRLVRQDIELSLCMIVRDNAGILQACLESIRPWVDEMIVVDTGSKDDTPRIAERLGARVFHFPWCDSFSAARNESLRHARGRWVFWMDSDDVISPDCGRQLRTLAAAATDPQVLGFVIQVHCPGAERDGAEDCTAVDHVKLFRNLPHLRFEGRIHEQILPAIYRAGGRVEFTPLFVVHSGYDHSPEGQARKKERDLRLLHLEYQEDPEHPFTLFNLGMTYADTGGPREAVKYLRQCIARSDPRSSHVRKAHVWLLSSYHKLGQRDEAWRACEEGLRLFPRDEELRYWKGSLLHERRRREEAVATLQDLLEHPDERHFASVVRGITGYLTRQHLAVVYKELGQLANAEDQWRRVVEEKPRYMPGWQGLGDVLVEQQKWTEADAIAQRLAGEKDLRCAAMLLRAQMAAAQGKVKEARRQLEKAKAKYPRDLGPLQALCRLLFEHGEAGEAERALQELIRRDPEDGAAHHNLGTLCLRLGRPPEAVDHYRRSLQPPYSRCARTPSPRNRGRAMLGTARVCLGSALHWWLGLLRVFPVCNPEPGRVFGPITGDPDPRGYCPRSRGSRL
jgi:GT2 family glycosyltransferase/tetratricopeptide (TPR) repeat protein